MAGYVMRNSLNGFRKEELIHVLCDPCRFNGKNVVAMKFCRDCNGHLCPNCCNSHRKAAMTRNHIVSYIMSRRQLPSEMIPQPNYHVYNYKQFETKCIEHSKAVVSFCKTHESLCCRVCIGSQHRECKLQMVSEAAAGNRDGRECRAIEANIRRLQARFEEIHREKESNLHQLSQQSDTFANAVKTYRRNVNSILDKLEQSVLKRKDRLVEAKGDELRGCTDTCIGAVGVLNGALSKLEMAFVSADEQQLFLAIKNGQALVKRYEKIYTDIEKMPRNYAFHFHPEIGIEKALKVINEFGMVKDDSYPYSARQGWKANHILVERQPQADQEEQASSHPISTVGRILSPRKPRSVPATTPTNTSEELNVRLTSDKKSCSITGADFLPDDKIVVADATNKRIKMFGTNLKPVAHLDTVSAPRDVATVSLNEIACTFPNDKAVQLIAVARELTVKQTIKLEVECYGITYFEKELYVTSGWSMDKEVQVLGMDGTVRKRLKLESGVLKCPLYLTIDQNVRHILVSDYENGVVGIDMTGTIVARYCNNTTKGYVGICSSSKGEKFICTLQPNSVSKIIIDNEKEVLDFENAVSKCELEPHISLPNKGGQRPKSIAYSNNKIKGNRVVVSFVGQSVDVMTIYPI